MSCEVKSFAYLVDTTDVKSKLCDNSSFNLDNVPKNELPLQRCLISLSAAGDVLAIALHQNIVILTSKWDIQEPTEVKNKFHITWNGNLCQESNEFITSILCLPLISLSKSSSISAPDWTCIAVGFNSGYLRFYTETGSLLLEDQLHNETVLALKFQSFSSPKHIGDTGFAEELYILYENCICILPGFPLFSTLRAYRNHLARVQANCNDRSPTSTLTFKKLGFKDQDILNDAEVIGTTSVNTFGHLMTASIVGGFNASYRSSAPAHNLIMATGKRPYIGFHFALEGGAAPVFSDVALAMASSLANAIGKIGTAVPWWKKSSSSTEKPKGSVQEVPEPMTCRFGISDMMREGDTMITSPNKTLSVITDTLGRVILVNNRKGLAIRIWKGYRDAQCGWIEVAEETQIKNKSQIKHKTQSNYNSQTKHHSQTKKSPRLALYLVIYAPKKGVIDIWGIQTSGKVTTFSASKNGRLLYVSHGLAGVNDVAPVVPIKAQYTCVFIDPLGGLKEILVPFHYSLSSKNGKRARDVHLFKKLNSFIREEQFDEQRLIKEVGTVCSELKTNEIRHQVIEMLMSSKHSSPDVLMTAIKACLSTHQVMNIDECSSLVAQQNTDEPELDPSTKILVHFLGQLQKVVEFYQYVWTSLHQPPEYDTIAFVPDLKQLSALLLAPEKEIERILKLSAPQTKAKAKVTFNDSDMFRDFISCFSFGADEIHRVKDIRDDKKYAVASLIFQGWMYSNEGAEAWEAAAKQSNINAKALMDLALVFWLNKQAGASREVELMRFTQVLRSICALGDTEEICSDYNQASSWWNDARIILMASQAPFQACTAALAARSVAMMLQKAKDCQDLAKNYQKLENADKVSSSRLSTDQDSNGNVLEKHVQVNKSTNVDEKLPNVDEKQLSPTGEWENVSKDACQFALIIGNLEDIAILYSVISQPPPYDNSMKFLALPSEKMDISLMNIVSRGKGSISEAVARWLAASGLDPSRLIDSTDVEFIQSAQKDAEQSDKACKEQEDKAEHPELPIDKELSDATADVLNKIKLLKTRFPYSLTSSVLLANLSWEFIMSWSKDISSLATLETALSILKQIPMKLMRQGVCCLLWTIHIKKRLEAAAKLVNKMGKLPKERLCTQEIGLSDIETTEFLRISVVFLDIFLDAEVLEGEMNVEIKSEELWEGYPAGPQAFASLAVEQIAAGFDLVMLHLQLTHVLHMIAHFHLRVVKPMTNLFESVISRYFFSDITDKVILPWYHDDKRDSSRVDFLCRVITASMESIHQETTEGSLTSTQAIQWMSKCQTLASIWKINNDKLRIHQVCQLYVNGFDRFAEEVCTAVNDTETLAGNLLPIASRRMIAFLSKSPDLLEEVSRISPALTQYLENLNLPGIVITSSSNEDTIELIKKISQILPESHSDYHIAQLMLDATFIYQGA